MCYTFVIHSRRGKIMTLINIRFNKEQLKVIDELQKVYNMPVSTMLKKIIFEKIEDDFDIQVVKNYESKTTNKTYSFDEYIERYGISKDEL